MFNLMYKWMACKSHLKWILCTMKRVQSTVFSVQFAGQWTWTLFAISLVVVWSFKIQWNETLIPVYTRIFERECQSKKMRKKWRFFVNEDFLSKAMEKNTNCYPNIIHKIIPNYNIERLSGTSASHLITWFLHKML